MIEVDNIEEPKVFDYRSCTQDFGEPIFIANTIQNATQYPSFSDVYDCICADFIARYHKSFGRDVTFTSGTDEHGSKITGLARRNGVDPIDICSYYRDKIQAIQRHYSVDPDRFLRTTDHEHLQAAAKCWSKCWENGDIYLDTQTGWYNTSSQHFVPEVIAASTNYRDLYTSCPYVWLLEESYFFRLSKYKEYLLDWLEKNPDSCRPEELRKEVLDFVENGLEDISVSLINRTNYEWGVKVPNNPLHNMYVWFDALTNYLTGINYFAEDEVFEKHWLNSETTKKNVIIVSRNMIVFHCVIWPAILKSAGLPPPNSIQARGLVREKANNNSRQPNTSNPLRSTLNGNPNGRRNDVSAGKGTEISFERATYDYHSDAVRFYLLSVGHFGQDIEFDESELVDLYNCVLAESLGNLLNRATNLLVKSSGGLVPDVDVSDWVTSGDVPLDIHRLRNKADDLIKNLDIKSYCNEIICACRDTNSYLADKSPWAMKDDLESQQKVINIVIQACYVLVIYMMPICPITMNRCLERSFFSRMSNMAMLSCDYDELPAGLQVKVCGILFPKVERSASVL